MSHEVTAVMAATNLIGVDVGGTFTDLILMDEATGQVRIAKVPTTVRNQAEGVLAALREVGIAPAAIKALVHGTTTARNPVPERMDAEGEVVVTLDEEAVRRAAEALRAAGAEALVIHFIHSYVNDRHERRAREIAGAVWQNAYVTVGAELLPEYREFERGSTAAINGYVQPVIDRYLRALAGELRREGCGRELLVMQGNGGTMSVDVAARHAVNTLMSGPAAGVKAAAYTALAAGYRDVISCDMGGTSFDVGVIRDGVPG